MSVDIEKNFYCPITQQIILEPIIADDGFIYEESALMEYFSCKGCKISPMTRNEIKNYFISYNVKKMIEDILESKPELKKEQFTKNKYPTESQLAKIIEGNYNYSKEFNTFCWGEFQKLSDSKKKRFFKIDENILIELVNKSINFNFLFNDYSRPIHYFCKYGNISLIKSFLQNPININVVDKNNNSPLHIACKFLNIECIKYLIEKGCEFKCTDKDNGNMLHYVCKNSDNNELIKFFIDNVEDLESQDNKGNTAVHYICKYLNLEILNYISEKNVNLDVKNKKNKTPIYYAIGNNNNEVIQFLLNKKVNIKFVIKGKNLLHLMCKYNGNFDEELLYQFNLNEKDDNNKYPIDYLINNSAASLDQKLLVMNKMKFDNQNSQKIYYEKIYSSIKNSQTFINNLDKILVYYNSILKQDS